MLKQLKEATSDSPRAQFAELFAKAQRVLELDDAELARAFKISRPTVGRWARGESAPHPLGRKPVFDVLGRYAMAKLRRHAK
jgi:DNA-binding transcriptional regulator YiaG